MLYLTQKQLEFATEVLGSIGHSAIVYINRVRGNILIAPEKGGLDQLLEMTKRAAILNGSAPEGTSVGAVSPNIARLLPLDFVSVLPGDDIYQVI